MAASDFLGIGLILIVFGAGLMGLARFLLSGMAKMPRTWSQVVPQLESVTGIENQDAILVIQPGGKVNSMTPRARRINRMT
jgi:hypothetical protein